MSIGRWSDGSSWRVSHEERRDISGVARERSGEVGWVLNIDIVGLAGWCVGIVKDRVAVELLKE